MSTEAIAALSGLLGVVAGAAGQALTVWFKASRDQTKDDRDFATTLFNRLTKRIEALEKAEDECRRDKEALMQQVGSLTSEVQSLRREVERLEKELSGG